MNDPLPPPPPAYPVPPRAARRRPPIPTLVLAGATLLAVIVAASVWQPHPSAAGGAPRPDSTGLANESGQYAFLHVISGNQPVRWNPCEPIHYVLDLDLAPQRARGLVRRAMVRVHDATGIRFVLDGTTHQTITDRFASGPVEPLDHGPGVRWAPVLIAWVTNEELDRASSLPYPPLGAAWSWPAPNDPSIYTTGVVAMNADLLRADRFVPAFTTNRSAGVVLMHELGHIVGLQHVGSPHEVMSSNPTDPSVIDWGSGDLDGLRLLGRSMGCLPPPRPLAAFGR